MNRLVAPLLSLTLLTVPSQAPAATPDPLPGSSVQAADGDQLDAAPLLDWQSLQAAGRVIEAPDDNTEDSEFAGGTKELDPGEWSFTTAAGGVAPGKNNILHAWYSVDRLETDTFLYFAFHRAETTGATFLGFEANQLATTWVNATGATVPCRVDGDALLSYEVDPSAPEAVTVVLYRWTATVIDPASGCSASGTFTADPPLVTTLAQGALNGQGAIQNFLPGAPATIDAGAFGEGAVNFTQIIGDNCRRYVQIQLHSRTSASISSALTDFVGPVPTAIGGCAIDVDKTGPATAHHGEQVTYSYAVTNPGSKPLAGVTLADDRCSAISGPAGDADGDGLLDLFETWTYTCTTTIAAHAAGEPDPLVNTATASGAYAGTVVSDQDTHTTDVLHPANLSITKTAPAAVAPGGTLAYTLTVANAGPGDAEDVTVRDELPAGLALSSVTASQGTCSVAGSVVACAIGALPAGAGAQVVIVVQPAAELAGTAVVNTATVAARDADPSPADNTASVTVQVGPAAPGADLVVDKAVVRGTGRVGDTLTYQVTVVNEGPGTATNVEVVDTLSSAVRLVSAVASQGSCSGSPVLRCALGTLAPRARVTITIRVVPLRAGRLVNAATATASEPDPRVPNTAISRVTIRTPLNGGVLSKRASSRSPRAGSVITYTISYRNRGPATARNVRVCDRLPSGLALISAPGARVRGRTVCWTRARVGARRTVRVRLRVRVVADRGRVRNRATVTGSNVTSLTSSERIRVTPGAPRGGGVTG